MPKPIAIDEFLSTIQKNPISNNAHIKNGYDYLREYGDYIKQSIKNGTSPFLPDDNGEINLQPAYDLFTKKVFFGYPHIKTGLKLTPEQKKNRFLTELENDTLKQILFLTKQKELNAPTPAFITFEAIQEAISSGVKCSIPKGTHGLVIPFLDKSDWGKINSVNYINANGQKAEKKKDVWFNISQIEGSDALAMYCKERIANKVSIDFANKPLDIEKNETISMYKLTSSTDTYLMQILASLENGNIIKVTPEQANKFTKNIISELSSYNKKIQKPDEVAIKRICNNTAKLYNNYRFENRADVPQKKVYISKKKDVPFYGKQR